MNITYIARSFWPDIGASAVVTAELAKGLAKRGHKVSLLLPNSAYQYLIARAQSPPKPPARLTIYHSGPRLSKLAASTVSFFILLLKAIPTAIRAHVILAHYGPSDLSALCAAIASVVARKPMVVRTDDVIAKPTSAIQVILHFIFRWCTLWSFQRAKMVFVTGDELIETVRRMYAMKEGTVGVCANGVNTEEFNPKNRSENLRRNIGSTHILVFSGHLGIGERLDVLLEAVSLLRADLPDLKALIMGDGPDRLRLGQLANSLQLGESVKFLGAVNRDLVPKYLASADVGIGRLEASYFTFGSIPLKVLEYMASGCIAVAGRGTVSNHLIIDNMNGLLAKSCDAADLARTIMRVFFDEELAERIRKNARKTVEESYDWEIVVSKLETTLQTAASPKRALEGKGVCTD